MWKLFRNYTKYNNFFVPLPVPVSKYLIFQSIKNYSLQSRTELHEKVKIEKIFDLLKNSETNLVSLSKLSLELQSFGLKTDDPRLATTFANIEKFKQDNFQVYQNGVNLEEFERLIKADDELIVRAFSNDLVIPNWLEFQQSVKDIHESLQSFAEGQVASYIPQLSKVDPSLWAVSVCTVDGQRFSLGDSNQYFTIQSMSKPITYAIALDHLGEDIVHTYVGKEPSGRMFNELILNQENKPHNPMINPGAIVICSMLHSMIDGFGVSPSQVFDKTKKYFELLAGGHHVGLDTSVYISEQEVAYRNYAISFYLKEHNCFPPQSKLNETLRLYFRCCSLEVSTDILANIGATLANSGIHPLTLQRIFKLGSVKNALSLMYSCGMYDFSGQFAFEVGVPAKSGVSGGMVVAIPDLMGIGIFSPRLGPLGNTKRGVRFCKELVQKFPFHQYDNHRIYPDHSDRRKIISEFDKTNMATFGLLNAAAKGQLHKLNRLFLYGIDFEQCDYDGRSALHLAAVEGHLECVEFLLKQAKVNPVPVDRWGKTPMQAAEENKQHSIVEFIKGFQAQPRSKESNTTNSKTGEKHKDINPDDIGSLDNKPNPFSDY